MGMTIDEIIAKEAEITQEFQEVIDTHMVSEDMSLEEMYCDDTEVIQEKLERYKELSDYHSTIANTMHKYQKIQEILKSLDDGEISYPQMAYYLREVIEDAANRC